MTSAWLIAFVTTIAVEATIAAFVAPRPLRGPCIRDSVFANFVTHPLATWIWMNNLASFAYIELGVFIAELLIFRYVTRLQWVRAAVLAFTCNAATAAMSYLT